MRVFVSSHLLLASASVLDAAGCNNPSRQVGMLESPQIPVINDLQDRCRCVVVLY